MFLSSEFCDKGYQVLTIQNSKIKIELLPDLGGKIWALEDLLSETQWLWQNPIIPPKQVSFGADYDENWAGGWDDIFPNDAPGNFEGRNLPDHGELWSRPWAWEQTISSDDELEVHLWVHGVVTDTLCEKWINVKKDHSEFQIKYRITNYDSKILRFLFKLHPAMAVTPFHHLEVPGGCVDPVDLEFSTIIGHAGPFDWPTVENKERIRFDLSRLPPYEKRHKEFVYIREIVEGWCGVVDTQTGSRIRFHFPTKVFPSVWVFMDFGGWRGYYTLVLEPCTNYPKDLDLAVTGGSCANLSPKGTLEFPITISFSNTSPSSNPPFN